MGFTPVEGSASAAQGAPVLPPARAEWTVNVKKKNAKATILGGEAVIYRSEKDGNFRCEFKKDNTVPAEGETAGGQGAVMMSFPLHDCPNLVVAQQRAEVLVRENLGKTHPELYREATQAEAAETIASAPADPF